MGRNFQSICHLSRPVFKITVTVKPLLHWAQLIYCESFLVTQVTSSIGRILVEETECIILVYATVQS